jgi:TP901 family phage tail tape measure protein
MANLGTIAELWVKVGADMSDLDKKMQSIDKSLKPLDKLANRAIVAGTALTGLGLGMEALISDNRKFEASLGSVAYRMGTTTDDVRGLALEMSDVGTSVDEVTATFDELSKTDVKLPDMKAAAQGYFTFADAFSDQGVTADEAVKAMIPTLNSFNIKSSQFGDHMDTATHALKNTNYTLGEYSDIMEKIAPNAASMNLSFEQTSAIVEMLYKQGKTGKQAISAFNDAFTKANPDVAKYTENISDLKDENAGLDSELTDQQRHLTHQIELLKDGQGDTWAEGEAVRDTKDRIAELTEKRDENNKKIDDYTKALTSAQNPSKKFYENLGITEQNAADAAKNISDAKGATEDLAKTANEKYTTFDKFKKQLDDMKLEAGELLEPLDGMDTTLMGIGTSMVTIASAAKIIKDAGGLGSILGLGAGAAGAAGAGAGATGAAGAGAGVAGGLTLGGAAIAAGAGGALGMAGVWTLEKLGALSGVQGIGQSVADNNALSYMLMQVPQLKGLAMAGAVERNLVGGGSGDIKADVGAVDQMQYEYLYQWYQDEARRKGVKEEWDTGTPTPAQQSVNPEYSDNSMTINMQNVTLSKDYTLQDMIDEQQTLHAQRGIRSI